MKPYVPVLTMVVAALLCSLSLGLYLLNAIHGWFWGEDLTFLSTFAGDLRTEQLFAVMNFGRFVSRNLYWHYAWQFFGYSASAYYLLNIAILSATAVAACFFFSRLTAHMMIGIAVGACLFCCGPSVANIAWLSNSQHLLPGLLAFTTLYLWSRATREEDLLCLAATAVVFGFGLFSNLLFLGALAPMALLLAGEWHRRRLLPWRLAAALLALLMVVGLLWLHHQSVTNAGPYHADLNVRTFWATFGFYSKMLLLPALLIVAAYLGAVALFVRRRDFTGLAIASGAVSFYLPFAFLATQHFANYVALPLTFGIATVLYALPARRRLLELACVVAMLLAFYQSTALHRYFLMYPRGQAEKVFAETMGQIDFHGAKLICIADDPGSVGQMSGQWLALNLGTAFPTAGNAYGVQPQYTLSSDPRCASGVTEVVVLYIEQRYTIRAVRVRP